VVVRVIILLKLHGRKLEASQGAGRWDRCSDLVKFTLVIEGTTCSLIWVL
jgi:hypothetical protein